MENEEEQAPRYKEKAGGESSDTSPLQLLPELMEKMYVYWKNEVTEKEPLDHRLRTRGELRSHQVQRSHSTDKETETYQGREVLNGELVQELRSLVSKSSTLSTVPQHGRLSGEQWQ